MDVLLRVFTFTILMTLVISYQPDGEESSNVYSEEGAYPMQDNDNYKYPLDRCGCPCNNGKISLYGPENHFSELEQIKANSRWEQREQAPGTDYDELYQRHKRGVLASPRSAAYPRQNRRWNDQDEPQWPEQYLGPRWHQVPQQNWNQNRPQEGDPRGENRVAPRRNQGRKLRKVRPQNFPETPAPSDASGPVELPILAPSDALTNV